MEPTDNIIPEYETHFEQSQKEALKKLTEHTNNIEIEHEGILNKLFPLGTDASIYRLEFPVGAFRGYPDFVDMALNAGHKVRMLHMQTEDDSSGAVLLESKKKKWEFTVKFHIKTISEKLKNIFLKTAAIDEYDFMFLQKCYNYMGDLLEYAKTAHIETHLTEAMFEKVYNLLQSNRHNDFIYRHAKEHMECVISEILQKPKQTNEEKEFVRRNLIQIGELPDSEKNIKRINDIVQAHKHFTWDQKYELKKKLIQKQINYHKKRLKDPPIGHPLLQQIHIEEHERNIDKLELEYESNRIGFEKNRNRQKSLRKIDIKPPVKNARWFDSVRDFRNSIIRDKNLSDHTALSETSMKEYLASDNNAGHHRDPQTGKKLWVAPCAIRNHPTNWKTSRRRV